jgi:hypothetical protein
MLSMLSIAHTGIAVLRKFSKSSESVKSSESAKSSEKTLTSYGT